MVYPWSWLLSGTASFLCNLGWSSLYERKHWLQKRSLKLCFFHAMLPSQLHTLSSVLCTHDSPFSSPLVPVRRAVFLLLFTPVTFWIWWLGLWRFTWRWWRRWWWRGRGWGRRVRLDTSGFIYLHTVCNLCYLCSFFLLKEAKLHTLNVHQSRGKDLHYAIWSVPYCRSLSGGKDLREVTRPI